MEAFKDRVLAGGRDPRLMDEFPEASLLPYLDNTWTDTGKALFNNWLGLVYQLTDQSSTSCRGRSGRSRWACASARRRRRRRSQTA